MTHRFSPDQYRVFQTEDDAHAPDGNHAARQGRFGFLGRVVEGTSIVTVSLTAALVAMTTAARADEVLLASATEAKAGVLMLAVGALFAGMLVMLRHTWRQTSKGIAEAQRQSHRIS